MKRIIGNKIIRIEETKSTNSLAKELALKGEKEGTVVIANRQSGGRGRVGRSFFSPDGKGIYMSVILKPEAENILMITSFAAVAVSRAVRKVCGVETGIKWVNDIYLNGKKLCGILAEGVYLGERLECVVLGIGINVKKVAFPEDISDIATSVENETGEEVDKEELEKQLMDELEELYKNYSDGKFLDENRGLSCVIGNEIRVICGNDEYLAKAVGIDDKGGLIIEQRGTEKTLYSGEISIRVV